MAVVVAGNTPNEAIRNAIEPVKNAVQYLSRGPILVIPRGKYGPGSLVVIQSGERPTKVLSSHFGALWIFMMIKLRVDPDPRPHGLFEAKTVEYLYAIAEDPELMDEMLTYHWTSEAHPPQRPYPHLHIGSTILNEKYRTKAISFPKLHIRTNRIPVEAFVLMLIEEFGAAPLRSTWRRDLSAAIDRASRTGDA